MIHDLHAQREIGKKRKDEKEKWMRGQPSPVDRQLLPERNFDPACSFAHLFFYFRCWAAVERDLLMT